MKIPDQGFGYKVADVASPPAVGPDTFVTRGVPELGAAGLKIGGELAQGEAQDAQLQYSEEHRKRVEAESEAKVIAREAKRARAMTVHARAQNDLAAAHDQMRVGIQDGSINPDDAPKLWAEQSTKIVDEHLKGVDRANVELVRAGLVGNVGSFGRSLNEAVVSRNRHEIGARLSDYLEQMQRYAVTDLEGAKKQGLMAIDAQGPLSGLNPEQVQKARQSFTELVTFNSTSAKLNGSMNNMPALQAFLKELPNAKDLDPGKKNILESKALTMVTHLENRAAAAENRRLTQLQVAGNRLEGRIAMGIPIPDAELAAYQDKAKGTVFEEFANGLTDEQKTVAELLKKSPAQQAAFVSDMEQKLVTTGQGNPKLVQRLKQTVASTIKLVNENPVQYAMDRGGAAIEPLDLKKTDSWAENLAHRTEVVRAQYRQVGGGQGVLMPQEAATLAAILNSGTPETKKGYLEPLRRAISDDAIFKATVQQFAKDSPVTAQAAMIATKETPLTAGSLWWQQSFKPGDVASKILFGEHLLNPNKGDRAQDGKGKGFMMPEGAEERAMRQRFDDTVGEVFAGSPDTYHTQLQTTRAYYAALTADKNGGGSRELDAAAWRDSIAATIPIVKFNGRAVEAPWGMDEATFKDRVANAFPQAVKAAGLPVEMAGATGRYRLQNLTGNTYQVLQGTDVLRGPKGPVVIKVPEIPGSFRDVTGKRPAVPD